MTGIIAYIVMFLLTFFAASYVVARCSFLDYPTDLGTFFVLVAYALAWPIAIPLTVAIFLLVGIAMLAEKLAGGAK